MPDLLELIKNQYPTYFFNRLWLETISRNPIIDYLRLAYNSVRAILLPLPGSKRDEFRATTRIALSSSENQARAIANFDSSALILNIFSLSGNDAAVFRYEFFRVFLILIVLAPFFAVLSVLHILLFGRFPYLYAVGCMLLGCCLKVGFQCRNINLEQKTGIVFGNDHFFLLRGIIQAWHKKYNLVYVQHGLIGPFFPNPNCFDEIYFDSKYSSTRYDFQIKTGKISKSKKSRFSGKGIEMRAVPGSHTKLRIGLGFQDLEYAEKFINQNIQHLRSSRDAIVRLHPRHTHYGALAAKFDDLDIHCASERVLLEFFNDIDLLVSEPSSLLIDSLFYGTACVQLNNGKLGDYYGLAEQEIIPSIFSNDLIAATNEIRLFDYEMGKLRFGMGK